MRTRLNRQIEAILKELKRELKKLYGPRLERVILFGSWARETATENSDLDVAVVLKNANLPGEEIDRMADIITELNIKYNTLISIIPIDAEKVEYSTEPLLKNIKKEGIPV